jgi:AraC-like DNA-binding protein
MLGTSPRQYIIKARIAAAQQMLLRGESIDRVCGRCGFNSLAHFSRTFKTHTGMVPSRFAREKNNLL